MTIQLAQKRMTGAMSVHVRWRALPNACRSWRTRASSHILAGLLTTVYQTDVQHWRNTPNSNPKQERTTMYRMSQLSPSPARSALDRATSTLAGAASKRHRRNCRQATISVNAAALHCWRDFRQQRGHANCDACDHAGAGRGAVNEISSSTAGVSRNNYGATPPAFKNLRPPHFSNAVAAQGGPRGKLGSVNSKR